MRALSLGPMAQFASFAPLVARVIVGIIMATHGLQKLTQGPGAFGQNVLAGLGVPLPELMGYVVVFVELVGGILLIIGLLSRLAALLLTINLVVAILLVKVGVGFVVQGQAGAELDLALIAGFLVVLLAGPGKLSVDQALGLEPEPAGDARRR